MKTMHFLIHSTLHTTFVYIKIDHLLLITDSKSLVDHILDGDKRTDACGDDTCGNGTCGDSTCGDGICGDGAREDSTFGDNVREGNTCGDSVRGDSTCGDSICEDIACGNGVDFGGNEEGDNGEGRINIGEREVFSMVVAFFIILFDV